MAHADKFMDELQLQCDFASFSAKDVTSLLGNLPSRLRNPPSDMEALRFHIPRIWHALHGLLVAAANISKIFWPDLVHARRSGSEAATKARGERLRQQLGVPEDSPLQPRSFRNHFEHVDERIEKWTGPRIDLNIGPEHGFGVSSSNMFRHFDSAKWVVFFAGERLELRPIMQAIEDLQRRLDALTT